MRKVTGQQPQLGEGALTRALTRATSALFLLLLAAPVLASGTDVSIDDSQGSCRVRASFSAPVSRAVAWNVLADYDSIGRFVSSVRTSRMERQPDGRLLLRQDAVGGNFLYKKRVQVLLEIVEEPRSRIRFHDVLGKDFRSYVGEWRIEADSLGTRVVYQIEAQPKGAVARALCGGPLKNGARDLLSEVRDEMIRRAKGARADKSDAARTERQP